MNKLDVYSDHQVPFDVSAFCRGRRYMPEAVALANELRKKEAAKNALTDAQDALELREADVKKAVADIEAKMRLLGEK